MIRQYFINYGSEFYAELRKLRRFVLNLFFIVVLILHIKKCNFEHHWICLPPLDKYIAHLFPFGNISSIKGLDGWIWIYKCSSLHINVQQITIYEIIEIIILKMSFLFYILFLCISFRFVIFCKYICPLFMYI